jgi:ABC-2 type transport system ATP-binding protein
MDPQSARTVRDAIGELRAADRTILLTTHNLTEAEILADRIAIIGSGRIIAEGTMGQLMRQLMGDPLWEIRLTSAEAASRAAEILADLVRVEAVANELVHYRCPDALHINPQILARLTAAEIPLVALAEVSRSLEDVYLKIVNQQQSAADVAVQEEPLSRQHPAQPEEVVS